MNLQAQFPEKISVQVAAELLGISPYEVKTMVVNKTINSTSYEMIDLAEVAKLLISRHGWDQDYTEIFIHQTLNPCANI